MAASNLVVSNSLNLEVLNRNNYEHWRLRMKTYLLSEDLWEVVEAISREPAAAKKKAWTKKNAKALYAIQNSCGREMFSYISKTETAKGAWEALEKVSRLTEKGEHNFEPYIPFIDSVSRGDWNEAKECLREVDVHSAVRALHVAARQGHVHIVKELVVLMTLEDLKTKNAEGFTALHVAASSGQVHTVKELVFLMAEEKNSHGDTALHYAVLKGKVDVVKMLVMLMRQEDLKIKNDNGYTALHIAVNKGNVPIVKHLVVLMGEVTDGDGDTALHIAVKKEQLDIVKELVLLMRREEDLAIKNNEGYTAFHLAIKKGNVPIVKKLVTKYEGHGENNSVAKDDFDRYIRFTTHVRNGDLDEAKECLTELDDPYDAITRVDPREEYGDTVLHVVAREGHVHILKELVSLLKVRQEEDLELKTAQDFTDFGSGINLGISEQVLMERAKYMVEQYEKMLSSILEVQNVEGSTALHIAVLRATVDIVKELVPFMRKEGFELKNANGDSPLHIAVMNENVGIVKELVPLMRRKGFEVINNDGYTALHKAVLKGNVNIVKELVPLMRQKGLEVKTAKDSNALHLAAQNGHMHIVKELVPLMRPQAMVVKDGEGYIALGFLTDKFFKEGECIEMAKCMAEKNKEIFGIGIPPLYYIPIVWACLLTKWDFSRYLYTVTPDEALNSGMGAFFIGFCIKRKNCLDIALDLLQRYPRLAVGDAAAHPPMLILARMDYAFLSGTPLKFWQKWIYESISVQPPVEFDIRHISIVVPNIIEDDQGTHRDFISSVTSLFTRDVKSLPKPLGINRIYEMKSIHLQISKFLRCMGEVTRNDELTKAEFNIVTQSIFKAIETGHVEFVTHMCQANPKLVDILDEKGRSIFHFAIEFRQENIYSLIYGFEKEKRNKIGRSVDNLNNNMLHGAGNLSPLPRFNRIQGASLQMQRELQWFKEVESIVPLDMHESLNHLDGVTGRELFTRNHKKLMEEAEISIKGTATSCTVVGSLIATMMFAAAFTIPGGNENNTGLPMFLNRNLFMAFIVSDTLSLVSSTTSVIIFLGLLTSRYAEDDFLKSLPKKMMMGLCTLFISIATMMIAFSSALMIMLHEKYSWVAIPSIFLGSVPIVSFAWVQFPLLVETFCSTYGPGIFNKK